MRLKAYLKDERSNCSSTCILFKPKIMNCYLANIQVLCKLKSIINIRNYETISGVEPRALAVL